MAAALFDVTAESRHVPFLWTAIFEDQEWDTPFFTMQVRNEPGDSGDPLISLENASLGSEGIAPSVAAGTTTLVIQIDKATLAELEWSDLSRPLRLVYDLKVTPATGPEELLHVGAFTIAAGVTQP